MLGRTLNYEKTKAYVHGRIEREIEAYADAFGYPRVEFVKGVGELLVGAPKDSVSISGVSKTKSRRMGKTASEVEVASKAHVHRASNKASSHKVKRTNSWFSKLSKAKQRAIIKKRVESTRKTMEAKKAQEKKGEAA